MRRIQIPRGTVYGRLTVLGPGCSTKAGKSQWICRCSCGKAKAFKQDNLRSGHSQSCGCFQRERTSKRMTTHGKANTAEYGIWISMKSRCICRTVPGYKDYGGRGIKVCERWKKSFPAFLADIGPRPSSLHSIDRINNDGNYEPGNVRWATPKEQASNTRRSRRIAVNGTTLTLGEWGERTGLGLKLIWRRLQMGWSPARAIGEPIRGTL